MLRNERFTLTRLLIAALALMVAAAGCSGGGMMDDEEGGREGTDQVPVAFAAAVSQQADTRADVTTATIASMGVSAHYTGQGNMGNYTVEPNFMKNERIACTRTSGVATWTYSPVKYWPNTAGDRITFCAYSPHKDDLVTTSGGSITVSNGMATINYTAPTKEAHQVDLLAANLKNATKGTALTFNMKHMLTKVEVKMKASMAVSVTSLKLDRVVGTGYFYWDDLYWEDDPGDDSTLGTFTATLGAGGVTTVPAAVAGTQPTVLACFYLPPFTPADASMELKYKETGSTTTEEKDILLPYPNVEWTMGEHLIYTIVIDKIKLSVKISTADSNGKWGEADADLEADFGNF